MKNIMQRIIGQAVPKHEGERVAVSDPSGWSVSGENIASLTVTEYATPDVITTVKPRTAKAKPAQAKPKAERNEPGLDAAESARYRVLLKSAKTRAELDEYFAFRNRINAAEKEQKRAVAAAQAKRQAPVLSPEPGSSAYYSRYHYAGHIGR